MVLKKECHMETPSKNKEIIALTINGRCHEFEKGQKSHQVSPSQTLAQTLRDTLGLAGTKTGCDQGACGSCTVLMNGVPVLSCMTLTVEFHGASVNTIEGLENKETGSLDSLQQAFVDHTAFQCGFCTPGVLISARKLGLGMPVAVRVLVPSPARQGPASSMLPLKSGLHAWS